MEKVNEVQSFVCGCKHLSSIENNLLISRVGRDAANSNAFTPEEIIQDFWPNREKVDMEFF
jgi:hypothetical protein